MAFSINQVVLLGNLTDEVELRYTPSGQAVGTFRMATNRSIKKNEEWEDVPTFHRVVVWGKMAEFIANSVAKGDRVYVDGRIENRSYEDKAGVKKYISEVIANNVIPMSKKKEKSDVTVATPEPAEKEEIEKNDEEEEIPF